MRNPLRSEAEAFRFVLLAVGYFAIIVAAAAIDTWLGVAAFAALTGGAARGLAPLPPRRAADDDDGARRMPRTCGASS